MTNNGNGARIRLKQSTGWFAAGASFETALVQLSDGAFRLFAWICLKADRHTGRFESTHRELALALSRSKRAIGAYVLELEEKEVCRVRSASNQHARTLFEVADIYWPYERSSPEQLQPDPQGLVSFVSRIRDLYLTLVRANGSFNAADQRSATELFKRGIPVSVVKDAMLLGCARKYVSSVNNAGSEATGTAGWEPIASLAYFVPLIEEVSLVPFSSDYRRYVAAKAKAYLQCSTRRLTLAPVRDSAGAKK